MNLRFGVLRSERGSILIVVVGVLILLVFLTVSVGRKTNQELLLIKYSMQKMQARYLSWAGFHYTLSFLREDSLDEVGRLFDDQYACGVNLKDDLTTDKIFKEVRLGDGFFSVTTGSDPRRFGMADEDGKLNLNALNIQNYGILKELLILSGVASGDAQSSAALSVDWGDEDEQPILKAGEGVTEEGPYGFDKKQFRAKNRPFDHVQELQFIPGISTENFEKLSQWTTVFPRRAQSLKINLATAPREVLLAMAFYSSGPQTGTSRADAESLITKVMRFRAGGDQVEGTADDQQLDENNMGLTMPERVLFRELAKYETKVSRFLRFRVSGSKGADRRQSHIDAVVDRETLSVVAWRND